MKSKGFDIQDLNLKVGMAWGIILILLILAYIAFVK